jgi:hypothetical protein
MTLNTYNSRGSVLGSMDLCRIVGSLHLAAWLALSFSASALAQPSVRYGAQVPPEVNRIYERGLEHLAATQQEDGSWQGGDPGSGITGLALMAFLASGEDPNFGKYSTQIQRAVRSIIRSQDAATGFIPNSMYHHGFATLALSEAYGAVDDSLLWPSGQPDPNAGERTIGEALELAVRRAVDSQKRNDWGAWRYSPDSSDADTSVSGAVLVGLLAARNAGIEVPDETIDKALEYYRTSTSQDGTVQYSGGGGLGESMNRSSIATLVFSVGKRRDWPEFEATLKYISSRLRHQEGQYPEYFRYYMAQALFQGDFEAWTKWKRDNIALLQNTQQPDGSFPSNYGPCYGTAMSLLSLALDYRFLPIYER